MFEGTSTIILRDDLLAAVNKRAPAAILATQLLWCGLYEPRVWYGITRTLPSNIKPLRLTFQMAIWGTCAYAIIVHVHV